jgi:transposase InsO family protein
MKMKLKRVPVPLTWAIDIQNNESNFHSMLFRLILKADNMNIELLRKGYPLEVAYAEAFQNLKDGEDLPKEVSMYVEEVSFLDKLD